jgi:DNA-binding winged helix-turn-helix (wHTH) protein
MRLTRDDDLQPLPPTADAITATVTGEHLLAGRNDTPALTIDQLPAGIVYLDGPGAAYAARGIIVSTALAAATGQPTRLLHLHPDDLAALLPEIDPLDLDAAGIERSPEPTDPQQTTIRIIPDPAATVHWQTDRDGITTGTGLAAPQRLCMLGPRAANDLLILVRHALVQPSESAPPTSPHNQNRPPVATLPADLPAPASLRLIGRCELSVAGRPIRIRRNAGLQILAYLAIHPQGASKAELIRACWPQQPPATITQRLHTTISDLRNQLRPLVNADPVTRNGEHYQLNQNVIDTDLRAWRNTTRAAAHAPDGATRIRASHELIALYQGELAAGHHWPWLQAAREALRRDVVDAYTAVADHTADPEAAELLAQALAVDAQNQDLPQRPMRHQ